VDGDAPVRRGRDSERVGDTPPTQAHGTPPRVPWEAHDLRVGRRAATPRLHGESAAIIERHVPCTRQSKVPVMLEIPKRALPVCLMVGACAIACGEDDGQTGGAGAGSGASGRSGSGAGGVVGNGGVGFGGAAANPTGSGGVGNAGGAVGTSGAAGASGALGAAGADGAAGAVGASGSGAGGSGGSTVDSGLPLPEQMEPGVFVQVSEARIAVGDGTGPSPNVDTFASVRAKLGPGLRNAAPNARSYAWTLSNGVTLTIGIGNTNADEDDEPPGNVDDADEVSWITVRGGFAGKTSRNVGLGSTRAEVEQQMPAGYGLAPGTEPLNDPAGTLARYFGHGFFVEYGADDRVRAVTIGRSYNAEPSARIDVANGSLDFPSGRIAGQDGLVPGTNQMLVQNILGYPDGVGNVSGGLRLHDHGALGIELFFYGNQNDVYFMKLKSPYYGGIEGGPGIGSPRSMVEESLGLGAGVSSATPGLVCYPDRTNPRIGVTYTTGATPLVSGITLPLLQCP
jgi:hypothetical protein